MPEVKFGLNQTEKPAPLFWRRLTNAVILSFVPAYVGMVQALPMTDDKRNIFMCVGTAIPFVMKGIGMLLGNGQEYAPSNQKIDEQTAKEAGKP